MAREPKKRIETNSAALRLSGNPFADLHIEGAAAPAPPPPTAAPPAAAIWKMGRVVLRRETARRGGKTVIVVHDFASHLPLSVIETVGKKVRQTCGCGGTMKERTLEIQLSEPARVRAALEELGFEVAGVR